MATLEQRNKLTDLLRTAIYDLYSSQLDPEDEWLNDLYKESLKPENRKIEERCEQLLNHFYWGDYMEKVCDEPFEDVFSGKEVAACLWAALEKTCLISGEENLLQVFEAVDNVYVLNDRSVLIKNLRP